MKRNKETTKRIRYLMEGVDWDVDRMSSSGLECWNELRKLIVKMYNSLEIEDNSKKNKTC